MDDLGESMDFHEFYNKMAAGAMTRTSQINVDEFVTYFEPFLKEGKDILHLSLSSGISGVVNSAMIAKEDLQEKYPDDEHPAKKNQYQLSDDASVFKFKSSLATRL